MQDNKHLNGYIADPDDDIEYDTARRRLTNSTATVSTTADSTPALCRKAARFTRRADIAVKSNSRSPRTQVKTQQTRQQPASAIVPTHAFIKRTSNARKSASKTSSV